MKTPWNGPGGAPETVFLAHRLSSDHAEGIMTLDVNGTASAGKRFVAEDFDDDGDIDISSAAKLGVHFIENLKIQRVPKAIREAQQPIDRKWPFPGEGTIVQQENGPADKGVTPK